MEKFINVTIATITAFLTSIAPVAAMENLKHSFNCQGEAFGKPVELTGEFNDNTGVFALSGPDELTLYTKVQVEKLPGLKYGVTLKGSTTYPNGFPIAHNIYIPTMFDGKTMRPIATMSKVGTRVGYTLTCQTSCSVCTHTLDNSDYCKKYCDCSAFLCGMW